VPDRIAEFFCSATHSIGLPSPPADCHLFFGNGVAARAMAERKKTGGAQCTLI
jgi:hypothetical protein